MLNQLSSQFVIVIRFHFSCDDAKIGRKRERKQKKSPYAQKRYMKVYEVFCKVYEVWYMWYSNTIRKT